jgi:hypothetical protein
VAGGIDWLRWHHGTAGDHRFPLVAKRAGARLGDVVTVWAILLEQASSSDDRGQPGHVDFEAIDLALDMPDGMAVAIHGAMVARGLIDGDTGRILAWDRRQPKREDETAAERKRRQREREHELKVSAGTVTATESRDVTPKSPDVTHGHDREEERREEEISPSLRSGEARKRTAPQPCPDGVDAQVWSDWLALRKAKKAPVTGTVVEAANREARIAGMTLDAFLRVWCARGSTGLTAEWLKPHERAGPAETPHQRHMRERMAQFAPSAAVRAPDAPRHQQPLAEVIDVTPRLVG